MSKIKTMYTVIIHKYGDQTKLVNKPVTFRTKRSAIRYAKTLIKKYDDRYSDRFHVSIKRFSFFDE